LGQDAHTAAIRAEKEIERHLPYEEHLLTFEKNRGFAKYLIPHTGNIPHGPSANAGRLQRLRQPDGCAQDSQESLSPQETVARRPVALLIARELFRLHGTQRHASLGQWLRKPILGWELMPRGTVTREPVDLPRLHFELVLLHLLTRVAVEIEGQGELGDSAEA
jgi:hypothetical protein